MGLHVLLFQNANYQVEIYIDNNKVEVAALLNISMVFASIINFLLEPRF